MVLWVGTVGAWAALIVSAPYLPWWLLLAAGGITVCLYGSLQHECLHGHPTRWRHLNDALAMLPLSLWLPYPLYRDSHLAHHQAGMLTCPAADPESFFVTPATWARMGPVTRTLAWADSTLLGRLLLGPWLVVARCWRSEIHRVLTGDTRNVGIWFAHLTGTALLLMVADALGLPPWQYVLFFAWPGLALTLQRSYGEHRPAADNARATAVVEAGPLWSLLYLNNNFHRVHHAEPGLAWYRIPALYREHRDTWLTSNDGYLYAGYGDLWRKHALTPRSPVHPAGP